MPALPSPRYLKIWAGGKGEARHGATSDCAESLLGSNEEGKVWNGDTERAPGMGAKIDSRRKRVWAAVMSIRSLLDTLLLLFILGLLLDRERRKPSPFEVGGDLTGFAPQFGQRITTFAPDAMFVPENGSDFFTDEVQAKWLSIVPKGLGYVSINDSAGYNNLPTPLLGYPDATFTTSVTHQLHCLHSLVQMMAAYSSNQLNKMPHDGAWHLTHCFDYIRQSIMCSADVALEGQQTTFPPGSLGSDGWDAKHVCRDYGQVLAHLEKNRADDEVWI